MRAFPSHLWKRVVGVVLALLALYLLYFAGLGHFPLTDVDEPVYAQVAKEMAHGDWLTPHYLGKPWYDKPPLFYWLTAAATRALGPGELASRLPSALMAVVLVLVVYALAAFDFGRRAGLLAAVVMGTCLQQIVLARAAVTDMTLAAALAAALYGLRRWLAAEGSRSRLGWGALAGGMVGLATLAKGPVAMVLVALTLVIYLALGRRLGRLVRWDALGAVLVALVVAVPWYGAMYALHREQFVEGFLVTNNLVRFLKPEHAEITGGWYSYFLNIPVLLGNFLPWTFFLPQALARLGRANEGARLAVTWAAVVFIFFSLSKTQLVTYIFPLFPALALLVGAWWDRVVEEDGLYRRDMRWGLGVGAAVAVVLTAALFLVARTKFPGAQVAGAVLGVVLLFSLAGALVGSRRRSAAGAGRALWAVPAGMVVFTLWLVSAIMPLTAPWVSLKPLLDHLPPGSPARVVSFNFNKQSMTYYGGGRVEHVDEAGEVRRLLAGAAPVYVICRQTDREQVLADGATVWARSGKYELLANPAAARLGQGE